MATKPTDKPDWTDGAPGKVVQPSAAKKLAGFLLLEKPAFDFFNWLFYNISQWINYFAGNSYYNIIIDSISAEANYASMAAYIAASPSAGDRVLIKSDEILTATLSIPAGIEIKQLKGTKFTISTTFTPVIQFANSVKSDGIRLETSNTTTVAKAISFNGNDNYHSDMTVELKSTGDITDAFYIEAGKESNYARCSAIDSGGGTITNGMTDNSGVYTNEVVVRKR